MISLEMPQDVRAYILEYQGKKKASSGLGHYSQQQAIIAIIREHKEKNDGIPKGQKEANPTSETHEGS